VNWQLENKPNSPTLSIGWQNIEYDYGEDVFGNDVVLEDNAVTVRFHIGQPANPFLR
jgi:hypothetical protein